MSKNFERVQRYRIFPACVDKKTSKKMEHESMPLRLFVIKSIYLSGQNVCTLVFVQWQCTERISLEIIVRDSKGETAKRLSDHR
jgi:hypothetical protein